MKVGDNLMEHITDMTLLTEQLQEWNENISIKKFAVIFVGSLPNSYENFTSSLNARNTDELEWDSIKGSLMEEYMTCKEKQEKQIPTSSDALFMSGHGRQFNHCTHGTSRLSSNRPSFQRGGSCDHFQRTSQSKKQMAVMN